MKVALTYQGKAFTYNGVLFVYEFPDTESRGFSISVLESAFKDIVESAGCVSSVFNNRPKSLPNQLQNFVVVSVIGTLEDMAAYGDCKVRIAMFARDVADFKNSVLLDNMQHDIQQAVPTYWDVTGDNGNVIASYEIDKHPDVIGDAPDDFGFHARILMFNVLIKVL